ncbi:unnamed protein product [Callosobruchus maculatus]|uniref:Uncharacterized protein n=1 Tax=Callosobruchus maculatus TaxID=64391 RepID=A0A653C717_CALMS|nr:unnamed protein product [Callosobruchus maculatus]
MRRRISFSQLPELSIKEPRYTELLTTSQRPTDLIAQ